MATRNNNAAADLDEQFDDASAISRAYGNRVVWKNASGDLLVTLHRQYLHYKRSLINGKFFFDRATTSRPNGARLSIAFRPAGLGSKGHPARPLDPAGAPPADVSSKGRPTREQSSADQSTDALQSYGGKVR